MFISRPVATNRHGALHGTACPFQAKQSNVFILLDIRFSRFTEANKNPLTYKPKKRPLLQPILKILCNFFQNGYSNKKPFTYKPN